MIFSPFDLVCFALVFVAVILLVTVSLFIHRVKLLKEKESAFRDLSEKLQQLEKKYSNEDSSELEVLFRLCSYLEREKAYLNTKLKVDEVAEAIHSSQREISFLLKKHKNQNFNSFINQYRVEEVLRIFNDANYEHYKLESIAMMSGFGSKQSFYNTFEAVVGEKPASFRQKVQLEQPSLK